MWIPAPLHETLPYLYVAVGGLTVAMVNNLLAWICGGFLVFIGSILWLALPMPRRFCLTSLLGERSLRRVTPNE
jgi:hypothetical protein